MVEILNIVKIMLFSTAGNSNLEKQPIESSLISSVLKTGPDRPVRPVQPETGG
jgi:hypothetical protein